MSTAGTSASGLRASNGLLLDNVDALLLDLDGTVYTGPRALPGVDAVLAAVRRAGVGIVFATNNASRTPQVVAAGLREMGIAAEAREVLTSAQAAAAVAADELEPGAAVLVVGGDGAREAVAAVGLTPVADDRAGPVAVLQGWGPDLGWPLLAEGAYALARGVPWYVTNTDTTLPTERGTAPGNGSFVALLTTVTGRQPTVVVGKPHAVLLDRARAVAGGRAALAVGDRLNTDIEGAVAAGLPSLLVLSGVSRVSDVLAAPPHRRPTFLAASLAGLLEEHPAARSQADGTHCRGWRAWVQADGSLRLDGDGDPQDALRACCGASWAALDADRHVDLGAGLPQVLRVLDPVRPGSAG